MLYKNITHQLECAIELLTSCNYHCEFCSGPRMKKSFHRGFSSEDMDCIVEFFNSSNKTWLIGMSGGEPSIHPNFYNLIDSLKEKHFFYFFSNLSLDIHKFINTVPPEKVQYFKASLHPEANEEEFLKKFDLLHKKGYNPILIMVSTPDLFDRIAKIAEIAEKNGYAFNLSTLEGPYQGKNYPNDYRLEEKKFIENLIEEPGNLIRLFNKTSGGLNTYGCECIAGSKSFKLDMETGNFTICESDNTILGNVYEKTFNPMQNNIRCKVINGCVGYDRNIFLPNNYIRFFSQDSQYIRLKNLKIDRLYPKNLDLILDANNQSSHEIKLQALNLILSELSGKNVFFWGAGIHGAKILYALMMSNNFDSFNFLGFIDSLKDRQKLKILGYPVYEPKQINFPDNFTILITSHAFENDIWDTACKSNFSSNTLKLYDNILSSLGTKSSVF